MAHCASGLPDPPHYSPYLTRSGSRLTPDVFWSGSSEMVVETGAGDPKGAAGSEKPFYILPPLRKCLRSLLLINKEWLAEGQRRKTPYHGEMLTSPSLSAGGMHELTLLYEPDFTVQRVFRH
ncbi:hypothetical protein MG293_002165 [Ovis ammon polii]|uniref:Uncharacterized protein n=1 Tax=Ovis ammon polii TaxID=230172 RepID=A0AAD4YG86_OVIAM|nr:hypothetical protein MG293_002165 [Ovis ammon polii]